MTGVRYSVAATSVLLMFCFFLLLSFTLFQNILAKMERVIESLYMICKARYIRFWLGKICLACRRRDFNQVLPLVSTLVSTL